MINYCFMIVLSGIILYSIDTSLQAENVERVSNVSSNNALIQRGKENDVEAILMLGKSKDASLAPILLQKLNEARQNKANPIYIRSLTKSLAKLGEPTARKEIIANLDSNNRYFQYQAFEDATYVGGNDMIAKLADKLFDSSSGGRPVDQDGKLVTDVGLPAPRHSAVIALSRIIDDPTAPKIDLNKITYNEENVEKWRKWWKSNKNKYDVSN